MDVRQRTEEIERLTLAPWATFSDASRGRVRPEEQDPIRPVFQRDRDRIIHCKAFRRLKQKTQVFLSPEGDLYRTRLTHTLEVAQIARTIARALRLNEDLTEAISLAHDLGHTPFGHAGESALDKLCPEGFRHYMQSLRVVDKLEKDGRGLNLTWEVRNGIVTHTKGTWAATPWVDLKAAYYKVDRSRTGAADDGYGRLVAFAEYKLSRRTKVYAELDNTRWRNGFLGAANKATATGISAGVVHTF